MFGSENFFSVLFVFRSGLLILLIGEAWSSWEFFDENFFERLLGVLELVLWEVLSTREITCINGNIGNESGKAWVLSELEIIKDSTHKLIVSVLLWLLRFSTDILDILLDILSDFFKQLWGYFFCLH